MPPINTRSGNWRSAIAVPIETLRQLQWNKYPDSTNLRQGTLDLTELRILCLDHWPQAHLSRSWSIAKVTSDNTDKNLNNTPLIPLFEQEELIFQLQFLAHWPPSRKYIISDNKKMKNAWIIHPKFHTANRKFYQL